MDRVQKLQFDMLFGCCVDLTIADLRLDFILLVIDNLIYNFLSNSDFMLLYF